MLCRAISWQLFAVNPVKMSADCKVTEEVIVKLFTVHFTPWGISRTALHMWPRAAKLNVIVSSWSKKLCLKVALIFYAQYVWDEVPERETTDKRLYHQCVFCMFEVILVALHRTVWHLYNRRKQVSTANTYQNGWVQMTIINLLRPDFQKGSLINSGKLTDFKNISSSVRQICRTIRHLKSYPIILSAVESDQHF